MGASDGVAAGAESERVAGVVSEGVAAGNNIFKYIKDFAKDISLYLYKEKYYLVFTDINLNINLLKTFCSSITEFAHFVNNSDLFESKLLEYGELVIKNNAINTCINHFC